VHDGLLGSRVRRIDMPAGDVVALTLAPIDATLLLRAAPRAVALGLVRERPAAPPAQGFTTFLRKHLEGAVIEGLAPHPGGLALALRTDEHGYVVHLERTPNVILERDGRTIGALQVKANEARGEKLGQPYRAPGGPPIEVPADLFAAGEALLGRSESEDEASARRRLARRARSELDRLARRRAAIDADRAEAARAEALAREAQLLVAYAHTVEGDAVVAPGEDGHIERIELGGLDPFEAAERRFHEARRLRHKTEAAAGRGQETEATARALEAFLVALEDDAQPLAELEARLGELTPRPQPLPGRREQPRREPYRTVLGTGERPIFVGKSAADNDVLTTKVARPHDLWLHARGAAGSHVVVPLEKGESIPSQLLVDAATLAAHFSDARGEEKVEVVYADKRFVRKPRGAPAGQVSLDRESTMLLRLEPARLARLLGQKR
jgi:predicted ribosome quality control (RQC) complex YloA/Tae2 family protein